MIKPNNPNSMVTMRDPFTMGDQRVQRGTGRMTGGDLPSGRYVFDPKTGKPVDANQDTGFGKGSIDGQELSVYNASKNIDKFASEVTQAAPKYQDYYAGQKRVQNVDADLLAQQRGETYRAPGSGSAWLTMAKGNIGTQRDQALSNLSGAAQGQKQSAWNRMGATGLTSGAMDRTGAKSDLAAAFGAQNIGNQANQQTLDATSNDELDRQSKLAGAPAMENAATAGSQYMLGQDLSSLGKKEDFKQDNLDTMETIAAAKRMGKASLPQDTVNALSQRGFR